MELLYVCMYVWSTHRLNEQEFRKDQLEASKLLWFVYQAKKTGGAASVPECQPCKKGR